VRRWCGGCDGLLQVFGVAMVAVMMVVRDGGDDGGSVCVNLFFLRCWCL
jgi:hypothetical protein